MYHPGESNLLTLTLRSYVKHGSSLCMYVVASIAQNQQQLHQPSNIHYSPTYAYVEVISDLKFGRKYGLLR